MKIMIRYRDAGTSTKMNLTDFPCSIGRAPGSVINLPHDSVSANHAVIEIRDGAYFIRDLGSRNGLISEGQRQESVPLHAHTLVSIGNIDIEVLELEASLNDQTKSMMAQPRARSFGLGTSFAVLSILPVVALLKTYFLGTTAISLALAAVVFLYISIAFFSAFSAWISSLFDQSYQFKTAFLRLFFLSSIFFAANTVVEFFAPYLAFNLDNTELWTIVRTVNAGIFISIFLVFYSRAVFLRGYRRKLGITGVSISALFGVLIILGSLSLPERAYLTGSITKPYRSFTHENRSLADLDAKMKESFGKIEQERQKDLEKVRASEAESGK